MTFREPTDAMRMLLTLSLVALFGRPVLAQGVAPTAPRERTTAEDHFLSWADFHFKRRYTPAQPVQGPPPQGAGAPPWGTPDRATARTDSNSRIAHEQLLAKRK